MFKNEFQGGPFFEVFSAQGKDPTSQWKLTGGSGIRKVYDKEVKSYVYTIEGSGATTKIQLPKDHRQSLTLIQRFLVLQICVPKGADFSMELGVTDLNNSKRRLLFSTSVKDIHVTPLHAKIPLVVMRRAIWLNLCLDLVSLVGDTWKSQTFKSIENIGVCANCRMRRIFTMKNQPADTTNDDELLGLSNTNCGELDSIPRQCQLALDVQQLTQVLTMDKMRQVEYRQKHASSSSRPSSQIEPDLNASGRQSVGNDNFHIAFGSKIPTPASGHHRRGTSGREASLNTSRERSSYSRDKADDVGSAGSHRVNKLVVTSPNNHKRMTSDPGSVIADDSDTTPREKTVGESRTWNGPINTTDDSPLHEVKRHTSRQDTGHERKPLPSPRDEDVFKQPHPPTRRPSDKRRRQVRVKSGSKERTPNDSRSRYGSSVSTSGDEAISPPHRDSSIENSPRKPPYSPRKQSDGIPKKSGVISEAQPYRPDRYGNKINYNEGDMLSHNMTKHTGVGPKSPRYPQSGDFKSDEENDDPNESVTELITVLQHKLEEEEDQAEDIEDNKQVENAQDEIYLFASPPKTAPRRSPIDKNVGNAKRNLSFNNKPKKHEDKMNEDFMNQGTLSSEDELDIRDKILRRTPSPRQYSPSPNNSDSVRQLAMLRSKITQDHSVVKDIANERVEHYLNDQAHENQSADRPRNIPVSDNSPRTSNTVGRNDDAENIQNVSDNMETHNRSYSYESSPQSSQETSNETRSSDFDLGPVRKSGESKSPRVVVNGSRGHDDHNRFRVPTPKKSLADLSPRKSGFLRPPNGSESLNSSQRSSHSRVSNQSHISISRKSLKEIPQDDVRLNQSQTYDFRKYQMEDLTESFEANMLASLKRQQDEEDEEGGESKGKENHMQRHVYGDDNLSDSSSDDTSFSTFRGQVPSLKSHHYQDEMQLPTSRMSQDPLASSNPRDWSTGVFSPPIVLPSDINKDRAGQLSPGKHDFGSPRKDRKPSTKTPEAEESDGEDELELLFDPCLNCYFDPKSCKYYELA